jgi:GAF domain-containing protein
MDQCFVAQLIEAGALIEQRPTLEDGLRDLAELAARSLGAGRCSVMLRSQAEGSGSAALKVCSHYGDLPEAAYREVVSIDSSISGRVLSGGQPLLINDVKRSALAALARQGDETGDSMMSAPIAVSEWAIGVINVSQPSGGRHFTKQDLGLLKVFAAFIGKSIQVFHLQKLSESRLMQMAALLERREQEGGPKQPISPDPAKLAKIVAKGFYRELALAGFGPEAIIAVATEVLGLLNENLSRHRSRIEGGKQGST